MFRQLVPLGLVIALLVGCQPTDPTDRPANITTDTPANVSDDRLSIEISLQEPVDTLLLVEVMSIGALDGPSEQTLFQTFSGFLDHEDRLFLANGGGPDIREYNDKGAYVSAFGRQGRGPGEFERLQWIAPLGRDSILAYDGGSMMFTVFDKRGTYGRSFRIPAVGLGGQEPTWIDTSVDPNIFIAVSTGIRHVTMLEVGGSGRDSVKVIRVSHAGNDPSTLLEIPNRWWQKMPSTDAYNIRTIPNGPVALVAVDQNLLFYTSNDVPMIDVMGINGVHHIRWRFADMKPTRDPDESPEFGLRYFGQIVTSTVGQTWVSEALVSDAGERRWHKLDGDGNRTAVATLPGSVRVWQFVTDGKVLGREVDELGVEYVKLFEFRDS